MVLRKVDPDTGMWLEDVSAGDVMLAENGEPNPAYIETPVPPDAGFWWPKWDFATGTWVEGLTAEEIAEKLAAQPQPQPTPEERIAALEAENLDLMDAVAGLYEMVMGGGAG